MRLNEQAEIAPNQSQRTTIERSTNAVRKMLNGLVDQLYQVERQEDEETV